MTDGDARYDVLVVGGGPAGLSAGLMLARVRRRVLVLDAGSPRNAPASHVRGLLGHDGLSPAELLERGRDELARYGGELLQGAAARLAHGEGEIVAEMADGRTVRGRRALLATGLRDVLPDLAGLRERWGRDVLHCPYCHGWEARDGALGVLHTGPLSIKQALLWRTLSDDVVYLPNAASLDPADLQRLAVGGVQVAHGTVERPVVEDDRLVGVVVDGRTIARSFLSLVPRVVLDERLVHGLGLEAAEHASGVGQYLPVDAIGRTAAPGVWAAGNLADPTAQVGTATAAAATAVTHLNADLVEEDVRAALQGLADNEPTAG
ncbi:MAG: NAD(P)/FAD-dependent oxidoreductase [Sporichthyaceae bacterium]